MKEKYSVALEESTVQSPSHYSNGSRDTWDAMLDIQGKEAHMAYCQGNVMKYISRYKRKGKPKEDLMKAKAYLERMIDLVD